MRQHRRQLLAGAPVRATYAQALLMFAASRDVHARLPARRRIRREPRARSMFAVEKRVK